MKGHPTSNQSSGSASGWPTGNNVRPGQRAQGPNRCPGGAAGLGARRGGRRGGEGLQGMVLLGMGSEWLLQTLAADVQGSGAWPCLLGLNLLTPTADEHKAQAPPISVHQRSRLSLI